ncbi:MAG TPA: phosphatase PAP2 family protein [Coxiellaceae bacterium]|nr:MAG: hypothetical protein A3E81_03875 [Gammaproteobacteria bacterium RIFCSPHIGHO2_12_FULL_36_30]HLB56107.1 phosphatase PAP2 family protein [Coxiellaceae bacterium]
MKLMQPIHFYKRYVTFIDKVFISLTVFSLIFGGIIFFLNAADFHYKMGALFDTSITSFSATQLICSISMSLFFLFYGMYIRNISPRSATFIWGMGAFYWVVLANMLVTNAVQATPFPPIDAWLVKIDRDMGFSTAALMAWTHNHPDLHHFFRTIYFSLGIELILVPILLTVFCARKSLSVFYIAEMSTMIIGSTIYFFFPTMAPSGIIHSPYFSHMQDDTSIRFYQLHHFLTPTSYDGGLIAFPSFHVIWAILLTYACRAKKIFLYPMAIYNFILIITTVFLGWHYLTDVIAGIILAAAGIIFAEWVYSR